MKSAWRIYKPVNLKAFRGRIQLVKNDKSTTKER